MYLYLCKVQSTILCLKMCLFDFAIITCMIDLIVRFHGAEVLGYISDTKSGQLDIYNPSKVYS